MNEIHSVRDGLVSVLMSVYNGEKFIQETIESVLNQSYDNFELLILDDGSTDHTRDIILSFSDCRISYFKNDHNLKIVASRNKLFDLANGDYFAILDADDIWMPDKLKEQVAYMNTHPECGLCGTWAYIINSNGKSVGSIQPPIQDAEIRCNSIFQSSFIQSSVMLRSEMLGSIRYDARFPMVEDYDLWVRLQDVCQQHNIDSFLTKYRIHGKNVSQENSQLMRDLRRIVKSRQLERIVSFSQEELEIIDIIGSMNEVHTITNFEKKCIILLKSIIKTNRTKQIYDRHILDAVFIYRWMVYMTHFKKWKYVIQFPFIASSIRGFLYSLRLILKKIKQ